MNWNVFSRRNLNGENARNLWWTTIHLCSFLDTANNHTEQSDEGSVVDLDENTPSPSPSMYLFHFNSKDLSNDRIREDERFW